MKKKSFGFGKKNFGSETDTEIGPWFRFPIPKPNFGLTLPHEELVYIPGGHWVGINIHGCQPNLQMPIHVLKTGIHPNISTGTAYTLIYNSTNVSLTKLYSVFKEGDTVNQNFVKLSKQNILFSRLICIQITNMEIW